MLEGGRVGAVCRKGVSGCGKELDATAAISLVSSNVNTNGDLSGLVDDCRVLLLCLPQVKLTHCFREANFCADALAKLGSASAVLSFVFDFPPPLPPGITQLLYNDKMGVYLPRLCNVAAVSSVS